MTAFLKIYYVKQHLIKLLVLNIHNLNKICKNAVSALQKISYTNERNVEACVKMCVCEWGRTRHNLNVQEEQLKE